MTRWRTVNNRRRAKERRSPARRWRTTLGVAAGFVRQGPFATLGLAECGCIPGHRSTHLTHICLDCGLADSDVAEGQPIPPCTRRAA